MPHISYGPCESKWEHSWNIIFKKEQLSELLHFCVKTYIVCVLCMHVYKCNEKKEKTKLLTIVSFQNGYGKGKKYWVNDLLHSIFEFWEYYTMSLGYFEFKI